MVRGWLTVAFISLTVALGDVVQRFVIAPWVKLRPSARFRVLGGWIKIMAWLMTRPLAFLSGSVIPRPLRIVPCRPGVLVVMNHQSLIDIPLVVQTVADGGYPRIVTRARYSRRIPLISHMIRLYQYPVVNPGAKAEVIRVSLEELATAARESQVPLAVFPEGTRTKDGEIGRFKRGALSHLLAARSWTVYVYVADGFWRAAKIKDFIHHVSEVRGKIEHAGVLQWTDPTANPDAFIEQIHEMMVQSLASMRRGPAAA